MRFPLNNPPAPSNTFGVSDTNARFGKHAGIDWPVPNGTPVYAAVSGNMSTIANDQYHGNAIDIESGGKWHRVMHLQKFARGNGPVQEGELIGYSNNTGLSTGPHVHFDIRTQQNPSSFNSFINPNVWLNSGGGNMPNIPQAEYDDLKKWKDRGVLLTKERDEVLYPYVAEVSAGLGIPNAADKGLAKTAIQQLRDKADQASGDFKPYSGPPLYEKK